MMRPRRLSLTALVVSCILVGGLMAYGDKVLSSPENQEESHVGRMSSPPTTDKIRTHLYFMDESRQFLRAEERIIVHEATTVERAKALIRALIDGPKGELVPTLPAETQLLALYVTSDGTAYVDFDGTISDKHPGGSLTERNTVFSVVNTLVLNLEEVVQTKIMIGGREAKTMAGHIDIRFPFRPNIMMIK